MQDIGIGHCGPGYGAVTVVDVAQAVFEPEDFDSLRKFGNFEQHRLLVVRVDELHEVLAHGITLRTAEISAAATPLETALQVIVFEFTRFSGLVRGLLPDVRNQWTKVTRTDFSAA
jgi:hypothetical protein